MNPVSSSRFLLTTSITFCPIHYILPRPLHLSHICFILPVPYIYPTPVTFFHSITFCPAHFIFALSIAFIPHHYIFPTPLHLSHTRYIFAPSVTFLPCPFHLFHPFLFLPGSLHFATSVLLLSVTFHCPVQVFVTFLHAFTLSFTLPLCNETRRQRVKNEVVLERHRISEPSLGKRPGRKTRKEDFHMASERRLEATAQEATLLDTDWFLNALTQFTFKSTLSKVHCKITAHW